MSSAKEAVFEPLLFWVALGLTIIHVKIENWDRAFYELTFADPYPEIRPMLPELTLPVFIVGGQEDRLIRPWYLEAVAAEIPDATLHLIPACGHVPQEECPEPFMDAVLQYLETP